MTTERTISEHIPSALVDERLDRIVALVAEVSRSNATQIINAGEVTVDGVVTTVGSTRMTLGATVEMTIPAAINEHPRADPAVKVPVAYEDAHLIVVNKPADLVVHPGAGNQDATLINGLLAHYPELASVGQPQRPGIVHRLDKTTSGLLLVARTSQAYEELVKQMSAHEPERIYQALVWGSVEADNGTIDAPIGRSAKNPTRMTIVDRGRRSVTHYQVSKRFAKPGKTSLLECRLETGRTHQIRVHLLAIGHPIVGDRTYHGHRPGFDLDRPFLHASTLRFRHPITNERIEAKATLPEDLDHALALCSA